MTEGAVVVVWGRSGRCRWGYVAGDAQGLQSTRGEEDKTV